jgi:hypothetical protein
MDERRARVIGEDRIITTTQYALCWHCLGTTSCACIFCGRPQEGGQWAVLRPRKLT